MKRLVARAATVLVTAVCLVVGADRWSRSRVAAGLSQRAAGPDAAAVLPELAALGEAGLTPLAEATASANRGVALRARHEADRLVRRWVQLEREVQGEDFNSHRLLLATALVAREGRFSPAGQKWLASIATRLLLTGGDRPGRGLVAACDRLLEASRQRSSVLDSAPPVARTADGPAPVVRIRERRNPTIATRAVGVALIEGTNRTPRWSRTGSALGERLAAAGVARSSRTREQPRTVAGLPARVVREHPAAGGPTRPEAAAGAEPPLGPVPVHPAPVSEAKNESSDAPSLEPRTHGLMWQAPRGGGDAAAARRSRVGWGRPRGLDPLGASVAVVAALPDRTLIHAWLANADALVKQALIARGFGGARPGHLATAVAAGRTQRERLAFDLASDHTAPAARLLLLLASDPAPAVRRTALLGLAESGSRPLVEAARRMAIRDPDPRVAAIAGRLPLR